MYNTKRLSLKLRRACICQEDQEKNTLQREDLIKYCYFGLTTAIGAYLRARREQFQMGWKDLADSTGVEGILNIERGTKFPTERIPLQKIFKELRIRNGKILSDLMISLENFRSVVMQKRFKL